jgi:hypothetical protein
VYRANRGNVTLRPEDDAFIHQGLTQPAVTLDPDPRTYERYWFNLHDREGRLMVVHGCGFYPNQGTADAFSIVVLDGVHISLRVVERRAQGEDSFRLGPIDAQIVAGLEGWRLSLDQNPAGISYELEWSDSKRCQHNAIGPVMAGERVLFDLAGFETFGSAHGWVQVGTDRFELIDAEFRGSRDRHWGVRNPVGGPDCMVEDTANIFFDQFFPAQFVELADYGIWGDSLVPDRSQPDEVLPTIVGFDREFEFDPDTGLVIAGAIHSTLSSGDELDLSFERFGQQSAYLRVGGYAAPGGGTPGTDHWMGVDIGDFNLETHRFDLSDPKARRALIGIEEHHCRITCNGESAIGLIEAHEPSLRDFCASGRPGYRFRGGG